MTKQNRDISAPVFAAFSRRLLSFMGHRPAEASVCEEEFNNLAMELFKLQFAAVPVYQDFCRALRVVPGRVAHWTGIPALPVGAFKEWDVSSLPEVERSCVFLSSGTGKKAARSRQYHNTASLRVYEASLVAWFGPHLLPELERTGAGSPLRFLALTPPGSEAPESSLVHMLETVRSAFPFSGAEFLGRAAGDGRWRLDLPRVREALASLTSSNEPVLLAGTAFSFVHLADYLAECGEVLRLAPGSRVMETGGYKGQSRVLERAQLHRLIRERLGIGPSHLVSEYGMSELSSQAYDRAVGVPPEGGEGGGGFQFPPWARVQVISPETGHEAADGETGLVRVFDLANVRSVMALQTEDLAVRRGSRIELAGRAADAEPRGCSLMARETAIDVR